MSDDDGVRDEAFASVPSPRWPGQGRAEDGDLMENGEKFYVAGIASKISLFSSLWQISFVLVHLVIVMMRRMQGREMVTCPHRPRSQLLRGKE